MHSDLLSAHAESSGYLTQALSQINGARRQLKDSDWVLDAVRILADALNSVQNEWSLSASGNTEEMGEVKKFKEMILSAVDEESTMRLIRDTSVSLLINSEPLVLNHSVLLKEQYRPGQKISDKLRKKAGEKHKKCRNKYEKITDNQFEGDKDGLIRDLAELLYIVRSNISHGHKTAFGPDEEQMDRDKAVCGLVAPVQLLIFDILLNRPSSRLATVESSSGLEKVENKFLDISADRRKCKIRGRIESFGEGDEFFWDPKGSYFDALYCQQVDIEWNTIDDQMGRVYERLLVPATTSAGLQIVNVYQPHKIRGMY